MKTNQKTYILKIITILLVMSIMVLNLLVLVPNVAALDPNNGQDISIHAYGDFGYFTPTRIYSRMSKMQAYYFPSTANAVQDDSSSYPIEVYNPVFVPNYFNTVGDIANVQYGNTTYISTTIPYSGGGTIELSTNYCNNPYVYRDIDGITTFFYSISEQSGAGVNPNAKLFLHGTSYGYYNADSQTFAQKIQNTHSSSESANVIVSISGQLEVYTNTGISISGIEQYTYDTLYVERTIVLGPQQTINLNWELISDYDATDAYQIMSKFTGSVIIGYTDNVIRPCIILESIPDRYSVVMEYDDVRGLTYVADGQFDGIEYDFVTPESDWDFFVKGYARSGSSTVVPEPSGTIRIYQNGTYDVSSVATAVVDVEQEISWGGMFDWIFDSIGAFMGFEIAPGWTIGVIMSIIVGLAIAIWALRVFMGG